LTICMVNLPGEPGKISLEFSSGKGVEEFKQEFRLTRSEAAAFLRELAEEIEAGGNVGAEYGSWSISMQPAEPICLEVEYEEDELEIEIKFKETPQMQVKGGL